MDQLGWDSCDIIIVCGDAYVDHPSFGMAIVGRFIEAQGFRVGLICQPDWNSKDDFMKLGKPNLAFAVSAGNMDSMINRYTADKKLRHDDAYTPNNEAGKRPDRATLVYTQRCKEAYKDVPVVLGGIEASLRRIAHYDYWSETIRRSVLVDSKADILVFGNAERPFTEIVHRLARGENIADMQDIRGTAVMRKGPLPDWKGVDSSRVDQIGKIDPLVNPYMEGAPCAPDSDKDKSTAPVDQTAKPVVIQPAAAKAKPWEKTYILLPSYEKVKGDKVLYAHASRILHHETNPGCARALLQAYGDKWVWVNPPALPLSTEEMDWVFSLPYQRVPHPAYKGAKIPAYDMIKTSVNIMRGCFGGCSFCSITEHEGRHIQSRSQDSILTEIEEIRDKVPGFTGIISDLGGPTANMYMLNCKNPRAEETCRRASCVYPVICPHMDTDHTPTIDLYRKARDLKGIKKILIASGVRYDLAVEDPRYIRELVKYHVGGYLKIAPEHTEQGPLSKMMKPGMGTYYKFKELFDKFSKEAGKEQFLIPYFISAHPGTTDEDMVNLALWLKQNKFRLDQVQNFYPSPLANATTMYYTELDPLHKVDYKSDHMFVAKGEIRRRLHKAILRYHDPANWPMLRKAFHERGWDHLIGKGADCLIPEESRTPSRQRRLQDLQRQGVAKAATQLALTRHLPIDQQQAPQGKSQSAAAKNNGQKSRSGLKSGRPTSGADGRAEGKERNRTGQSRSAKAEGVSGKSASGRQTGSRSGQQDSRKGPSARGQNQHGASAPNRKAPSGRNR